MLRVLLRWSPLLPWQTTAQHASEMNKRMQHSGYGYQFRRQVTNAALNKYKQNDYITNKNSSIIQRHTNTPQTTNRPE